MSLPTLTLAFAQQLLASSSDGLLAYDRSVRCLFWNAAMERISGMKAADVVGQPLLELFPFLVENGEERSMRRALEGEEEVGSLGQPFAVLATDRRGFFDAHYAPLRDEAGAIVGGIA